MTAAKGSEDGGGATSHREDRREPDAATVALGEGKMSPDHLSESSMTYAPDERRPPEAPPEASDSYTYESGGARITIRPRPPKASTITEEALAMERSAWKKADIERRMLRVRVDNLRAALIECVTAIRGEAPGKSGEKVSDVVLTMEGPDEVRRLVEEARQSAAEFDKLQKIADRLLLICVQTRDTLKVALDRILKLEAERKAPLGWKELHRAAQLVTGWKGRWIGGMLELGDGLVRRGIAWASNQGAADAALAEIDRLRGVEKTAFEQGFEQGYRMGDGKRSWSLSQTEIDRAFARYEAAR